jgi:hypothetical protein
MHGRLALLVAASPASRRAGVAPGDALRRCHAPDTIVVATRRTRPSLTSDTCARRHAAARRRRRSASSSTKKFGLERQPDGSYPIRSTCLRSRGDDDHPRREGTGPDDLDAWRGVDFAATAQPGSGDRVARRLLRLRHRDAEKYDDFRGVDVKTGRRRPPSTRGRQEGPPLRARSGPSRAPSTASLATRGARREVVVFTDPFTTRTSAS